MWHNTWKLGRAKATNSAVYITPRPRWSISEIVQTNKKGGCLAGGGRRGTKIGINLPIKSANCNFFTPLPQGWFSLFAPGPCTIQKKKGITVWGLWWGWETRGGVQTDGQRCFRMNKSIPCTLQPTVLADTLQVSAYSKVSVPSAHFRYVLSLTPPSHSATVHTSRSPRTK